VARTTVDNNKSKKIKNKQDACGQHRMHLDALSVVARCADCDVALPIPVLTLVTEDYVAAMPRLGILVSWPTGAEVARA
jgi:hypothetical protein